MGRLETSPRQSFSHWTALLWLTGLVLLLLLPGESAAEQALKISGVVYFDANENGTLDTNENGLAGVAVSNQKAVVTTGPGGRYELPDPGDGIVFVTAPDEYESVAAFWHSVGGDVQSTTTDFPLVKSDRGTTFRFIHASDVHLSEETLPRIRELRVIVEEQRPEFVVITGDLIHDALRVEEAEATGYYELFLQEIAAFPAPVLTVAGNHEIFGIERHRSLVSPDHPLYGKAMYRHFLGPTYYSFNAGGIHFVGLDSVDFDDLWYYGHVDETQLEWLRQDLAAISEDTPVVVFQHIPFITAGDILHGYTDEPPAPTLIEVDGVTSFRHTVSNAAETLKILRQRDLTLALAGHDHMRETLSYEIEGVQTRFHNAASVRSDAEAAGLAFESGVTIYEVRDGRVDDGSFIAMPNE